MTLTQLACGRKRLNRLVESQFRREFRLQAARNRANAELQTSSQDSANRLYCLVWSGCEVALPSILQLKIH